MEILSPKVIPPVNIMTSVTGSFEFIDPILNVPMTKSITTITFPVRTGINHQHINMGNTDPTDPKVILYGGMQGLMKSCVDNAEDIKNRIHQIVLDRANLKSEEERVELMKLDFMKLKKLFMDDVRASKIYQEFKQYNSTKKLKTFSQVFNTFILDRNKYTHGQLCFISPNYDYALEYIETPSQQKRYALIDTNILLSYNNCYKEIMKVIAEYQIINQAKKMKT
ncbi:MULTISPECIES: hypothetical protein [unclassified Flavobacterium]|uniref:hypothetical protein n=1 Tax=unclassified Flavobacterium TaxID=196869 RepID=UPI0006ABC18A|nr:MULTISPECIES: hypothetical protein [unclassified Flavobacterium]KOP38882.1 hypothetical protein AKO67_07625 [Flavobacterium sp. VMW]OWU92833.1 hypothetical protein APR43_01890 [Flavobacterium sp. NLM]